MVRVLFLKCRNPSSFTYTHNHIPRAVLLQALLPSCKGYGTGRKRRKFQNLVPKTLQHSLIEVNKNTCRVYYFIEFNETLLWTLTLKLIITSAKSIQLWCTLVFVFWLNHIYLSNLCKNLQRKEKWSTYFKSRFCHVNPWYYGCMCVLQRCCCR